MRSYLAALVAVLGLLFGGTAQAVTFFTDTCSGGGASLTCTFTANAGFLFIDSQAANLNLAGTVQSASETFSGGSGAVTSSTISFNSPQNVDGLGLFNFTDDLKSNGGNPTVSTITFTINGAGLALLANSLGNTASAHICEISSGTACASTFFATPSGQVGAVPLPGALPLFATGLVGLVVLGRRRMKQAAASAA